MSGGGPSGRSGQHVRLTVLVLAALAGAGCCAGASAISWWTRGFQDPLAGAVHASASGADLLGELVPVALVVLAGLGATSATRGVVRRVVGVLVSLAGVLVAVRSVVAMASAPIDALQAQLIRPATPDGPAHLVVAGPSLAVLGGLLVMLAGVLVASGADRARGMGSAYDAPGRRREQALQRARSGQAGSGADAGDLWRAMDAGADPTDVAPNASQADNGAAPGRRAPSGPDTMSPPDGPVGADHGQHDPSGPRDAPARSRQAPNEETTG